MANHKRNLYGSSKHRSRLSGGTIAVSLGIYDDIIRSIATIKSEMKKASVFLFLFL